MRNLFFILFIALFSCKNTQKNESLLVSGISADLATYRKDQVSDIVYHLSFNIPSEKDKRISSKLELSLQINDLEQPLYLDFNEDKSLIKQVTVNGDFIEINHQKEHLIIAETYLKKGKNVVTVVFDAGETSLNRSDDYLYTLLVPDRASTLFPCFDQPDLKANYILDITAPKTWQVLCGAPLELKEDNHDYIRYLYKMSDKMSTYLFSFVAGVFNKTTQRPEDMEMTLLFRENDSVKINASVDDIFMLHQQSLDFLEDYTQYDFPFQKLDFVAIPEFQYGGMEHVGAVQYRESSLFLDETATQERLLNRAQLIAHETAHMWFGDLVTMKWFDDVWLKEVFANFMAGKIVNGSFPEIDHRLRFMQEHYPSAYSEDRTLGATPIRQKLGNLKNAGTLYGNIIYHKAPIMMRQLEIILGEAPFRSGMRQYVKKYANGNADWNDLVTILDNETSIDLKQWSEVWVNQSGRPIISDQIAYKDGKISNFDIYQSAEDGSDNLWTQTFSLGLVYDDSIHIASINIKDKKTTLSSVIGMSKPRSIIYNYKGLGYGVFPMDLSNASIFEIKDDVARSYSYINLYESMLNNHLSVNSAFNELLKGINTEKDELIVDLISSEIRSVFLKYFTEEQREKMLGTLENILKERLSKNLQPGIKKTIFNLYRSIAFTIEGKDFLYGVWNKTKMIEGLRLNENDYTNLAVTLAIYNHEKSDEILKKALDDIVNSDRKKRFEFMLPSLSNKESDRDAFMISLSKPENREKESWVLSALSNIHHPLRQQSAKKHLRLCLDLLEEIQLTGDIFFPKSWLNATIGNYSSHEAYKVVQDFLTDNPNFNPVLKNKLLQSTDGLYRVRELRKP
ncbi:M1 family aminopeptidase [Thalassobellus suaedae]|uniref:Aminopeptidase N n=1 Tax=Thalassobellus suaedae TaxID=3074124 RepID=A0ABY9Y0V2_9FLAO|nr:M1 family aminopeptidase [Flavobacteriaceae bacterium HL-DH10]